MLRFSYRLFILIVNCSLFILNNLTAVDQSYLFSIMCIVLILFLQGGERERVCVYVLFTSWILRFELFCAFNSYTKVLIDLTNSCLRTYKGLISFLLNFFYRLFYFLNHYRLFFLIVKKK